jgi:translocation and assembly module TamB
MPGIPGVDWWPPRPEELKQSVAIHLTGSGFANAAFDAQARSRGKAGDLDLDGTLDLRSGVAWDVRRFAFQRLDLARLLGDTTSSSLNGTLTTVQRDPRGRNLTAQLALEPSRYGTWQVKQSRARVTWQGDQLGAALSLEGDAGSLDIQSMTARLASPWWIRLNAATFRGLDLARLTEQPALASRLDGTLRGELRGFSGLGDLQPALRQGRLTAETQLELAPSQFRGQQLDRGSARLSLARGDLSLQGTLASPSGTLELAAHGRPFDRAPFYAVDRAHFLDADLGAWTQAPPLTSRLSGVLTAEAKQPAASPPTWEWHSMLRLDPSSVGATRFQSGEASASWAGGGGHLDAALRCGTDTLTARGNVTVRDGTSQGEGRLSVPFRVLAAMAGLDTLPRSGGLVARSTFAFPTGTPPRVEGTVAGAGTIGDARLDSLFALFHLRHDLFTLDTLRVASNAGTARGAGQVAMSPGAGQSSDLRVALALHNALPLRRLFRLDTLHADTARFAVHLHGDGAARHLEAQGSLRSVVWNDTKLAGADFTLQSQLDREWQPQRTHLEAQLVRLERPATAVSHAEGRWDLNGNDLSFDVSASHDPEHRIHAAGQSSGDSARKVLTLAKLEVQSDSVSWALAQPARLELYPTRFVLEPFELRSPSGEISAGGIIDRRGDQNFHLQLRNVGLDLLAGWIHRSNLTGTVNADFELAGPAAAPRGSGTLAAQLAGEGGAVGTLRSRFTSDGSRLNGDGAFVTPANDSLTWAARLPLVWSLAEHPAGSSPVQVLEGDVEARTRAQHFPLAALSPLLDPRAVGTLAGTLDMDAHLGGSSHALVANGSLDLAGGSVPLPGLGVVYQDIELHSALQGDRFVLRNVSLSSQKGQLQASGEVRLASITRVEPHVHLDAHRFVFADTPDLRAIASGAVDVSGTLTNPIVKGDVSVENSSLYLTPEELGAASDQAPVRLTEADRRMLEDAFGDVSESATSDPALDLYDASDLDLKISLSRNNWVRQRARPKLSVAASGDFRLRKAPHADPELFGRIEPIPGRGYVEQFARSFDITGGQVLLNGPMDLHRVDIRAEYKPPSEQSVTDPKTVISLQLVGPVNDMRIKLTSDPPMSEAEIVNYIATGRSAADWAHANPDATSSLAKDIGLSQVTGLAEERAQEATGLDVLQVRFDAVEGATLVGGRYVDPKVYLGFRQPLQYKQESATTSGQEHRTSFEVEYAIYRWMVFNLQGEVSSVRSFLRFQHAY